MEAVNRPWIDHLLIDEEREQFKKDGYLLIEDALDPDTLEATIAAVDRIDARMRKEDVPLRAWLQQNSSESFAWQNR